MTGLRVSRLSIYCILPATICYVFAYSAFSKVYIDSLNVSIAYLFVEKLDFESCFLFEPQSSFLAQEYLLNMKYVIVNRPYHGFRRHFDG